MLRPRSAPRFPVRQASLFTATALLGLTLASPTNAQLLDVHSDTLTTYKAAATTIQGAIPQASQRGMGLDGTTRAGSTFPFAISGNPFENAWSGHERQGDLRLDTGGFSPMEVDIALPSAGVSWVIGRTYNSLAKSGSTFVTTDSYQGKNWHQSSQPEIVLYDDADNAKDVLYLVYGADRFVEFVRKTSSSNQFKGRNGATGCFDYVSGSPDTWVLTDTMGTKSYFLGFNTSGNTHNGLLWKIVDPAQNTAFVGDKSSVSTAISSGWDSTGRILKAYDQADRRYSYAYTSTSYGGKTRLESVKAETKTGGTWTGTPTGVAEVYKVEYSYYGDESHGDGGDLKMVKTTMPLSDSGVTLVKKKLYRYWEGTSDGTSAYGSTVNGEIAKGYVHQLKYVYDSEGLRRYDYAGDATFDEDFLAASDETLKSYAAAYMEHESGHKVSKAWFNGQCGCGSSANGAHEFTYEAVTYTNDAGYDNDPAARTVIARPDGTYLTQYFDELGQGLSQVVTDVAPASYTKKWVTTVARDANGCVESIATPATNPTYTHSTAAIGTPGSGLVWAFTRETTGNFTGYVLDKKHKDGPSGTAYFDQTLTWTSTSKTITDVTVVRPLVATSRAYGDEVSSGTTGSFLSSYSYTAYADATGSEDNKAQSLVIEATTSTQPSVDTSTNGSGSSVTNSFHRKKNHQVDFEKDGDGIITYRAYTNGQVSTVREDADTGSLSPPSGFASSGTELDRQTTWSYNAQGLFVGGTKFAGWSAIEPFTYRSMLKDGRPVVLEFPDTAPTSPETFYGPVRFMITNHAGRTEASGIIALAGGSTAPSGGQSTFVDETDDDPITALDLGTVAQMSTEILFDPGVQPSESRRYFTIPASGAGTEASNYDATKYNYDDMGRQRRVKEASGTIRRSSFDTLGRTIERWIGTNDSSFTGGESTGTDNMVKTELIEYDGNADDGNSLVTKRTARVESTSTNERVTTYTHDLRGRVLLETTPTAPYAFHKYDNMGRRVATGMFSSTASIVATSDDPTTETANRLALSQTFYDAAGRVWKSQRHKIDATDGSDDDNLQTLTWFDADGRVIKVDGEELAKTIYDRLGRVTDQYILAKDNDASYSDVSGITGDIVLEERQTRYDGPKDDVILSVRIDRLPTDYGPNATGEPAGSHTDGKLDSNADSDALLVTAGNLQGRAQISAMWYDDFGRITDQVEYGTNGGSNFDRDGLSVPARSDTALRTSWTYNTDGTTKSVEDPRGLKTFWVYDAMGRQVREVKSWNGDSDPGDYEPTADSSGIAGSVTNASNVTVRYEYSKGLRTKLIADLPTGETDQETVYTYGTTKGTAAGDSKIATGHLPQKETYPDSGGAGDVVTHAYNAQSQGLWKQDQAGNVYEMDFDAAGRVTHKRVTTLASGFDGAAKRITSVYDSLGRTSTVTQYDNATVGSGTITDEVKYTYEGWGNIEKFEQDKNSAVGASGSVDDYEVSYAYAKQTTGRNTIRRTSMTLPSGKVISYTYLTRNGIYDNPSSRVTEVKDGSVALALYDYLGVDQVVGTDYTAADVFWKVYKNPTDWDLDNFNRVRRSCWTRDITGSFDFYHVDLIYDRNSNVVSADDQIHTGFDVVYSMDNNDRLTRAEEGTLSSGSISSRTRDQQWTLGGTGNWKRDKVDLNGDGDFTDSEELNDTRAHNAVNELNARDTDSNNFSDYGLTYDAAGNMTDDGKDYEYVWDAFYRLRKINRTDNQALVAEFKYNGVGYRIAEHSDTDADGDVDANDKWFYDAFDERWRQVSRFREIDTSPKEECVPHQAGASGDGGSSYIDLVICRYKDANTAWTSASDGTLEEQIYYCQNWRADVSVLVSSAGKQLEYVKYSAYGVPFGLPAGDADSDGDCEKASDVDTIITGWINTSTYDVRGDVDLDGDVDATDKSTIVTNFQGVSLGSRVLSGTAHSNSRGYSGVACLGKISAIWDVRIRVFTSTHGRWLRRDPLGYVDQLSLYQYCRSNPTSSLDPFGLESSFIEQLWGDTVSSLDRGWERLKADVKSIADPIIHVAKIGASLRNDVNEAVVGAGLGVHAYFSGNMAHIMNSGREAATATGYAPGSPATEFNRHCTAACESCKLYTGIGTDCLGATHEYWESVTSLWDSLQKGKNYLDGHLDPEDFERDQMANKVGIRCCRKCPPVDCKKCCAEAFSTGTGIYGDGPRKQHGVVPRSVYMRYPRPASGITTVAPVGGLVTNAPFIGQ